MVEFMLQLENGLIFGSAGKHKIENFVEGKLDGLTIDNNTYYREKVLNIYTLEEEF